MPDRIRVRWLGRGISTGHRRVCPARNALGTVLLVSVTVELLIGRLVLFDAKIKSETVDLWQQIVLPSRNFAEHQLRSCWRLAQRETNSPNREICERLVVARLCQRRSERSLFNEKASMNEISYILFRTAVRIWNVVYDLRFGASLRGELATKYAYIGAYDTANTSYLALSLLFSGERITGDDVLVDVGCGKGRVINWWLNRGISNAIIGLELDPEVSARTRDRLRKYPNVTIISGDAVENLPSAGTLFLVANPFDRNVVKRFKERILKLERPDRIRIFYYNSESADIFANDPRFIVGPREIIPERCTGSTRRFLERFLERTVVIRLTSIDEAHASGRGKP